MNRSFLLGLLAYLVPTFILGFVWHLVAFHDFYRWLNIYRPDVIVPFGFLSMLVQGVFFAWAYPRLFNTDSSGWMRNAVKAGAAFAALSWSFTTLAVAAKHPMTSVPYFIAIETGFTLVQFALVAPLMALACRVKSRA